MCSNVCQICPRLVISQAVTFADGVLTINLPAGSYNAGERYCVVVAQAIPDDTTIAATVEFTIGTGTATYPLTNRCCAPVTACALRTRTRYAVEVVTTATGGNFRLLGRAACAPVNNLPALDGTAPAAGGDGA